MTTQPDPYFTPIDDVTPFSIPDSIEGEELTEYQENYQFIQQDKDGKVNVKWILISVALVFTAMLFWQTYSIFIEIMSFSTVLGVVFAILVIVLVSLVLNAGYRFRKGQQHLATVERLRQQAEVFIRERSYGKSTKFIEELSAFYTNKPQQQYLQNALEQQPDYLNDAEISARLSADFLCHLDDEAQRLLTSESLKAAGLIALSQLVILDVLVVLWKSMSMVNQINNIYGLTLTRIGQWQVFIKIIKAAILDAGTEIAFGAVVEKSTTGLSGTVASSVAQGLWVGTYIAKIGIEAMKQSRPIAFEDDKLPSVNLITDGIRQAFAKKNYQG